MFSEDEQIDFEVAFTASTSYTYTQVCARVEKRFEGQLDIDCGEIMIGRYAWVYAMNLGYKRRLTICEMEVYGSDGK